MEHLECPLCEGTNWVLQRPDRLIGATYVNGSSGDEKIVPCPIEHSEKVEKGKV